MDRRWTHTCARVPSSSVCIQACRCPTHTRIDLFHVVCTHVSVSTPLSCARARVCAWVCARVCVWPLPLWHYYYGSALHACKLRELSTFWRECYSCVKMSISPYACGDRPCSHPSAAYNRARACVRARAEGARVRRPRVCLTRHPCVRYV